jgi:methionyl-tRNA formyltransferase
MSRTINKSICLAGKNEIGVYGLKLLLKYVDKSNLRVVYNEADDGFHSWQPSLLKAAAENNVTITSLEDCYDVDGLIFFSLEFYKLISPQKFYNANLYNIHFSNLPAYKGMYTSALPLLYNEKEAGVTLHHIDSGIDTGDIIDQIIFPISESDTARDLYDKYLCKSKELFKKNLFDLLNGTVISHPQSSFGSTYFSKKAIDYKNLVVNLNNTANQISNQIRAFYFPEYQVPKVHGYHVRSAKILKCKSTSKPGTLLKVNDLEILISSVDYNLILYRDMNAELFTSATENDGEKALFCLANGADVNQRNGKGWTPLIVASFNGAESVIKILLENDADIDIPNYKGTTPLMYAMANYEDTKNRFAFDILIKFGANKYLCDNHGLTIKDYAKERNVLGLFD